MKCLSTVGAIVCLMGIGCSNGKVDNGPTIFGFTPALRAEMRKLVAANDPKADPDKVVNEFMDLLRKSASALKGKPSAAGDYELAPEQEQQLAKAISANQPGAVRTIVNEFGNNLPKWVEPLVAEDESGRITPEHKEILVRYVMLSTIIGLSK